MYIPPTLSLKTIWRSARPFRMVVGALALAGCCWQVCREYCPLDLNICYSQPVYYKCDLHVFIKFCHLLILLYKIANHQY